MRAVNLIPSEQRSGSAAALAGRSGGAAYVVIGVICGLAVMALLYGLADHEIGAKQAEATRLSAEAHQAQAEASKLAPYTSFVTMREERLKTVQELANTRFDWAHVMHELGRVLPSDAVLSTVTGTVGASTAGGAPAAASATTAAAGSSKTVTSATPAGSVPTFTIAGCATTQSEVALTMNRLRLIDGVSEVTLQSSSRSGGSGGSCPAGSPSFAMQVSFDSLPVPSVKTSAVAAATSASDSSTTSTARSEAGVNPR
jgi:Tfp pilus assembly protein PilN